MKPFEGNEDMTKAELEKRVADLEQKLEALRKQAAAQPNYVPVPCSYPVYPQAPQPYQPLPIWYGNAVPPEPAISDNGTGNNPRRFDHYSTCISPGGTGGVHQ